MGNLVSEHERPDLVTVNFRWEKDGRYFRDRNGNWQWLQAAATPRARCGLLGFSSLRRRMFFWVMSAALIALLLFAAGCGAVDHAKVTQRLEQRIEKLERRWAEYISIDAPSSARVDSSIAKIRKAIELLTWRLQRMQK